MENQTKIASMRNRNGMSQSQLAENSGVNVRMIQYYEQRKKDINKAQAITVRALANALNCKMEDIMEEAT